MPKELSFTYKELLDIAEVSWYERVVYAVKNGVKDAVYGVKYAWQRLFRGYDDRAWWNMDRYLSDIISKLSHELRTKSHGTPASVYIELGFTPSDSGEYTDEETVLAEEKWANILSDIEEGFKEYIEVDNCMLHPNHDLVKFNRAFDLFREYFSALWD